jgi:hypothetical protein
MCAASVPRRPATAAGFGLDAGGLLVGFWAVPLRGLTGDGRDALEIMVAVEQGESLKFGCGGDDEADRSGVAVLASVGQFFPYLPGAVVDGAPPEEQDHVVDGLRSVGDAAGAEEEFEFGDRADGDESGGCGPVPPVVT